MEPLETISVESPDIVGAKTTKSLIKDTLADLSLTRVIVRLKVYVDPVEPVFIFTAVLRLSSPPVRIKDFAKVEMTNIEKDEVKIELSKETYVVKLLGKLWDRYGKGNISQPEQKVILIQTPLPDKEVEFLNELIIEEPQQEVLDRLIDAVALRIIPEGFRVRKHELTKTHIMFVASEDTLKPEWIERGKEMMKSLKEDEEYA
ncbi:MAG: methanogenesis marker 17 protein [Candidatus Methanoperedens sp.]|jgi:putative methanogenesis marker protein 17|nr:methanogenesis marker 17 protein [Candidatus Methanoperedens sp.]PKL53704.1 MAG: methanogenesis marker 17 protein [Candidatus Methanoperedenaceae archaeon HGW-Methanoperedenaceae-1]